MPSKRILIVGGVAGGASAAARLRRLDEAAEIIVIERGEHISYANCGLPYYVGGPIRERERLFVATPGLFRDRFHIEVRTRTEAVAIDRDRRQLMLHDLAADRTYAEGYDYLILSPGAAPLRPSTIPGLDNPNVYTLRSVPDADALFGRVVAGGAKSAVVVGGGLIGLELAENLIERGLRVGLVEAAAQVFPGLDCELAAIVHEHLRQRGVSLHLSDPLQSVRPAADGRTTAVLASGHDLTADFVVLSIGVRPEVKLASAAGLTIGENGGIVVDARMRTNDPRILAVGDAVESLDFITGQKTVAPLAGPANRMGRLAAETIAADAVDATAAPPAMENPYRGTLGTAIAKVFDLAVAVTGKNEAMLTRAGLPYHSCVIHPDSHAGYYPGADPITLKLLFAPSGKLYGAQAVGRSGVDKRIDVLATAMAFGAAVRDLQHLELAYAPPYGSAKDPVNMIGFVAGNVLDGSGPNIAWHDVAPLVANGAFVLDVREPGEFELGHPDNAVNIPIGELRGRLAEIPRDRPIVVFCQVGLRAYLAVRILRQNGFTGAAYVSGGWRTYRTVLADLAAVQNPADAGGASGIDHGTTDRGEPEPLEVAPVTNDNPALPDVEVDCTGLACPGPIMTVFQTIKEVAPGQVLRVTATDPGFRQDIGAWCSRTGNELLSLTEAGGQIVARIRKGGPVATATTPGHTILTDTSQDKTIVVFSGELDKALASFVIANGAAAMGRKVTMFFTFWGLNVLRRPEGVAVRKGLVDRMFGLMLPRGTGRLKLSKLHMAGMGTWMMKRVMEQKRIASLEAMVATARRAGVHLVACQMSMDMMGIRAEELIDGVEIGGVASYLAAAEQSNVNLFI